jgi:dynein heavy chain
MYVYVCVRHATTLTLYVRAAHLQCRKMPKQLRDWEAYTEVKKNVEGLLQVLPLLQMLCSPAMRPRHWRMIQTAAGSSLDMSSDNILLGDVLDMGLQVHYDAVHDICHGAVKELEIEDQLLTLKDNWADTRFEFQNFKNKGPVLLKARELQDILDRLEESSVVLSSMAINKYSAPFRDQVNSWSVELSSVSEVIELWTVVQSMWIYLEAVFLSSEIAKQLPQEAKRFAGIDKSYMALTAKAFEVPNVIQCCHGNEQMRTLLPHLAEQLEICQRSLAGYLEGKRALFPRFYFVSDKTLLEILSHGTDAAMATPHIHHVFGAICDIRFDNIRKDLMVGMVSNDGEEVSFSQALEVKGTVEEYMSDLVLTIRTTLKNLFRDSLADADGMSLDKMVKSLPSQLCVLALYVSWTSSMQEALAKSKADRHALAVASKRTQVTLSALTAMSSKDVSRLERANIEALVTVETHIRDTTQDLVNLKTRSVHDWEWQRRMRVYWSPEKNDVSIGMADAVMEYMYEYVGCTQRLVVTPLTERVWIGITQALSIYMGAAVAGTGAAGKSETVKELGIFLARYTAVVSCVDQMHHLSVSKLFKGAALSGCWACFDDFDRLRTDALSMAAQHIQCVLTAMHERRKEFVYSDGQTIPLLPGCSFLLTLSPRTETSRALPENLKILFRATTMSQADVGAILRVKLSAAGFGDAVTLASKFEALYTIAADVFFAHKHYDWGLRSMLVALRALTRALSTNMYPAFTIGQKDVLDGELRLLMTVLRDMNLPRLLPQHVPIFLSIMEDLVPGIASSEAYADIVVGDALSAAANNMCIELHTSETAEWCQKLIHANETLNIRHGVGIIGATYAGKSTILDLLANARSSSGLKHVIVRVYPRTLTHAQFFGAMSDTSTDWTDGALPALWRKAVRVHKNATWLVIDGSVDPVWAEGMNTVLGDAKALTLANGDRLPMLESMRVIIEADHLNYASPATISRLGIVHVGVTPQTWRSYVDSWLSAQKERSTITFIRDILLKLSPGMLDAANRQHQTITYPPTVLMANALALLGALLQALDMSRIVPVQEHVERLAAFSMCWALGAMMDREPRARFESDCRRITSLLPSPESGGVYEHQVHVCVLIHSWCVYDVSVYV